MVYQADSCVQRQLRGALKIPFELDFAAKVLHWPAHSGITLFSGSVQGPGWISQMGTRQRAQIGAASADDGIDMIGLKNIADGDGGHPERVADAIGKRGLKHPPVNRLFFFHDLAR